MPYPEIPPIPPIEICNGCNDAEMLGFVNDTIQERVMLTEPACHFLTMAEETGNLSEGVVELAEKLDAARRALEAERAVVARVNGLDFCNPGAFCARIISYRADGGVYLGQSYRKPPLSDLDEAPLESS